VKTKNDMKNSFNKIISGYKDFREKYAHGDKSIMQYLADNGQKPHIMVVACCDSRVDPALILQCDPGDLFVVRNVANIVPPFEKDDSHHGTSAALEFAVRFLGIKHLIVFGHSQCGGIITLLNEDTDKDNNDFISNWVSIIKKPHNQDCHDPDQLSKEALKQSYQNCMSFPWIKSKVEDGNMLIHLWFFDIKTGQIFSYSKEENEYTPLSFT
jgi:carbonic anhydrase